MCVCLHGAGDPTQGFTHARQVLYHWATSPFPRFFKMQISFWVSWAFYILIRCLQNYRLGFLLCQRRAVVFLLRHSSIMWTPFINIEGIKQFPLGLRSWHFHCFLRKQHKLNHPPMDCILHKIRWLRPRLGTRVCAHMLLCIPVCLRAYVCVSESVFMTCTHDYDCLSMWNWSCAYLG
jgi:hypothetical protein